MSLYTIIDNIACVRNISFEEMVLLLDTKDDGATDYLAKTARKVADEVYGKVVYKRGLIEFTNYCKNNCLYCGIRNENKHVNRYRLSKEEITACTDQGYELGFRTFVLQGGEDPYYSDEKMCDIVAAIKRIHPDCAVTLSIGERTKESYQRLYEAGADRYLLRHETADEEHYGKLHPHNLCLSNRMKCLQELKEIGYQVGCGFMVGSPYQTYETIYKDLMFIREFEPHMVGIGPFIPHHDTPFKDETAGTLEMTLKLLSIIRLIHPKVLLPATTALGTIHPHGRERGILAGANVVMPNLSPVEVRKDYLLYDNKLCTGEESAQCSVSLHTRIADIGYMLVESRGDSMV